MQVGMQAAHNYSQGAGRTNSQSEEIQQEYYEGVKLTDLMLTIFQVQPAQNRSHETGMPCPHTILPHQTCKNFVLIWHTIYTRS